MNPVETGTILQALLLIGVAAGLYACSLYNYLLFHSLAELFSIAVGWSIFIVAWNVRKVMESGYLLFLGIGFLFIGLIDLLHTLSYKGMEIFPGYDANLPTQLWIAWQYLLAITFLAAPGFIRRKLRPRMALVGFAIVTTALIATIFLEFFPDCFIEGRGLTRFKKISEILTALILAISAGLLQRERGRFSPRVIRLLTAAILTAVIAKTAFIFYTSVYGLSNLVGHGLMLLSFFLIYKAIVETGISAPSEILFRELKQRETELEHTGRKLTAATEHLEQLVAIRTQALTEANSRLKGEIAAREEAQALLTRRNAELEEINQELDDFAYIVSHDLQEPLRGIFGYTGILMEDFGPRMNEEGRRLLQKLSGLARRQSLQIAAVLRYSRIGRATPHMARIDTDARLREVLDLLKITIDEAGAEVRIPRPLPPLVCDPDLLIEVFQNLVSNAVIYNDKERKQVEIGFLDGRRWPSSRMEMPESRTGNGIVFYVRDNGIGIDARFHTRIFQIFKRLHRRGEYGDGTGAGLTIVRKIVEYHGGEIWLSSVPGQGTTFFFTISTQLKPTAQRGDSPFRPPPKEAGEQISETA